MYDVCQVSQNFLIKTAEQVITNLTFTVYVLRAYFDTELLIAESKGKIAHDFRVFFMGHKGSMEARYTTNKGMLPEILVREMRDAFKRSEEFLDLETSNEDPILEQKEAMQQTIRDATPEELGSILEMFQCMNIGNMGGQDRLLSHQIAQSR